MPHASARPTGATTLVLALALAASACDGATDPFGGAPRGLRVSLNGTTLIRIDGTSVEGALHIHVREYSGQFIITPVTSGGAPIANDGAYTLDAFVGNAAVATFVPVSPGAFEGEIVSQMEGGTTLTFRILGNGAGGGVVYAAPPIELVAVDCGTTGSSSYDGSPSGAACAAERAPLASRNAWTSRAGMGRAMR